MSTISHAGAAIRLTLFLVWTLVCLPLQLVLLAVGQGHAMLPFYWRIVCRVVGLNVRTFGALSLERPTLYVANHVSYLDILVLGSLLKARFVAKSEVAGWPGISFLAIIGRTLFIDRRPARAASQTAKIAALLQQGESLIIFPEGTSTDGNRMAPFKSALFSAAEFEVAGKPLLVQPLSITYTRLNGMPMGRVWRPLYAWYGDMSLAPHLWRALGLGQAEIEVEFHPPVRLSDYASRKGLAQHCERMVRHGLSRSLSGRRDLPPAAKPAQEPAKAGRS